jgi:hypothetical protein
MRHMNSWLGIVLTLLLLTIITISPGFAAAPEMMPQIGPNDGQIITEHEEDDFLPYQSGNEARVEYSLPASPFTPYGLFDNEIKNVKTSEMNLFKPLTEPLRNDYIRDPLPVLTCSASASITVSASVNANVGIDAQIVKAGVGYEVQGSATIAAGQEYSFPIPYGVQGTIVMRYSQLYSTFDVHNWLGTKIGSGNCWGLPYSALRVKLS